MRWRLSGVLVAAILVAFGVGAAPASAEPPVNDGVAGAVAVPDLPYTAEFDVSGATADGDDEAVDSLCGLPPATHSVWFSLTSATGISLVGFARTGTYAERGMNISVMAGGSGSLQPVSCYLPGDLSGAVLSAGTRYLVRVSLTDAGVPAGTSGTLHLYRIHCPVDAGGNPSKERWFDVDGDGCEDLAIGAPAASVDGAGRAGAVEIAYGKGVNQFEKRRQRLEPGDALGVPVEPGSGFGSALALGPLDGDVFDDLAIGIPRLDAGDAVDAGAVLVLFGGPDGLGERRLLLRQGDIPGSGSPQSGDHFGAALAIGDHGGILAVGVPGEDVQLAKDAGAVVTFSGLGRSGTTPSARQLNKMGGVAGGAEAGDRFGSALAFGGGTMFVGVPGEDIRAVVDAGALVMVLPSGASKQFSQDSPGMGGVAEAGDRFGASIQYASGRIAIGAPGEDAGSIRDAGMINFLNAGTHDAPWKPTTRVLTQDTPGVPGKAERGDGFGSVLSSWRCFATCGTDLLVGVPDEDVRTLVDAGAVWSVHVPPPGGSGRVTGRVWTQDSPGVSGTAEAGDRFGASLATIVVEDGVTKRDAVYAGVPGEDISGVPDTGFVQALGYPSTRIHPSTSEAGQHFGAALQPGRQR